MPRPACEHQRRVAVFILHIDLCARTHKERDHVRIAAICRLVQNVAPAAIMRITVTHARIPVVVLAKRDPQQQGRGPSAALPRLLDQ